MSDAARVSLGYLSEVERGRKEASSELLSAICDALDIPMSRVLSTAGEQMARELTGPRCHADIDATTKVVIPQVVLAWRWQLVQPAGDEPDRLCTKLARAQSSRQTTRRRKRSHGQSVRQGVEVPDGAVQLQGRRVRRPEGADPAGHRGRPAPAPGADPAGRPGHRQPASAGDEAEPPARRHREAAGQRPPGPDAGRSGDRQRRRRPRPPSTPTPPRRSPPSW